MFNLQTLTQENLIIYECISGSRAYGLALPTSDTDIRGVFVLPEAQFYGLEQVDQVSNPSNDIVYYELRKYVDLLSKNNPNLLEMLYMHREMVQHRHPVIDLLRPELFLSKLCKDTFAGYALTQIRKARGLNKKILNPVGEERKSILEFCYIIEGQGTVPLNVWLAKRGWEQEKCGLVNIPHMRDMYGLYYPGEGDQEETARFKGVCQKPHANEVLLSSVPKGRNPVGYMCFNKDGYKSYCKDYKEYWSWVKKRNEVRYENTLTHGKNYDAKNMMHTFRLLGMAQEIAETGKITVERPNREELLKIRAGEFEYEELIDKAEVLLEAVNEAFEHTTLPEQPAMEGINDALVQVRQTWYRERAKK